MNHIDTICCAALKITNEEIEEICRVIEDQRSYNNPLMPATTAWQHRLADYNEAVLTKVKELKDLIDSGKDISCPKENVTQTE